MPFSVNRWMGGTLTNFETVSTSLTKYKKFLRMEEDGSLDKLPGKEGAASKDKWLECIEILKVCLTCRDFLGHVCY